MMASLKGRCDGVAKVWLLTKHCNNTCERAPVTRSTATTAHARKDSTCTAQPARRRGNWPRARFRFARVCVPSLHYWGVRIRPDQWRGNLPFFWAIFNPLCASPKSHHDGAAAASTRPGTYEGGRQGPSRCVRYFRPSEGGAIHVVTGFYLS